MTSPAGIFFIGVDGGGTRCRVRLRAENGEELAFAEGGPANIHADYAGAVATIRSTMDSVIQTAGLSSAVDSTLRVGLGLAGVVSSDDGQKIRSELIGFSHVTIESDAAASCIGAHGGADGGLVIAGTGSAGFARVNGITRAIGGRGFSIGDNGSAARIGWEALRQSLLATDDLGPSSRMTKALMRRYDDDPTAVTRFSATARSVDYGALAPIVFDHAMKGDPVALPIIKQAAADIFKLYAALHRMGCEKIALVGGLADPLKPFLELDGTYPFAEPLYDGADGAILMIGGNVRNNPA
jgi:glucosamine kinase